MRIIQNDARYRAEYKNVKNTLIAVTASYSNSFNGADYIPTKNPFHFLSTMQEHDIRKFANREISRGGDWRKQEEGTEAVWVYKFLQDL